jgi:hypothetical protein
VELQCKYRMNDEIVFWNAERVLSLFLGLKVLCITTSCPPWPTGGGDDWDKRDLDGVREKARAWLVEGGLDVSGLPKIVVRFSRRGVSFVDDEEVPV